MNPFTRPSGTLSRGKTGRLVGAIAGFVVGAVLGYAALRLQAAIGEPDPRTVGPSVHIPYFWRLGLAGWWGSLGAVGAWRFPAVGAFAERWLALFVAVAALLAFLVP